MKDYTQMGGKQNLVRYIYAALLSNYKKVALLVLGIYLLIFLPIIHEKQMRHLPCKFPLGISNIDNLLQDIASKETSYLVPNYIHFYRFGSSAKSFNLAEIICLLAAYRNQKPDRMFIHTDDVEATAKSFYDHAYGRKLMALSGFAKILHIVYYPQPEYVFGIPFSTKYHDRHISDLARLRILRKFGGIFLDNDVYLSKDVNALRKQEFTVLSSTRGIENSLILCHRDSRFLSAWITSYMKYNSQEAHHHNSKTFLDLVQNFTPRPIVVRSGVHASDVQTAMTQGVPERETEFAIKLDFQLQKGAKTVDYLDNIPTIGKDFIDKYFDRLYL